MSEIVCIVGVPGSGKTWITNHSEIKKKFHHIWHDGFIYLKKPGAYLEEILHQAPNATKPILIEAPFGVNDLTEALRAAGHNVKLAFIIEDPATVSMRYLKREKKMIPKGHLTRMNTYAARAKAGLGFGGTSDEVLKYLQGI